jgi:hypothetical protein
MTTRKILTVGLELASPDTQYASFQSKMSLLDWDIVLFKPLIEDFISSYSEYYQGKPSLNDSASFQLKECCEHWRREIKQAIETGKTVIMFLPTLREVYIDTGQRSYSGTGRNQRITRHVAPYNNYQAIPANLSPITATGTSMKLSPSGSESLVTYWSEFESVSQYHVILTEANVPACLVTRAGDKPVGALYRSKGSSGSLLLLPDIDFYADHFIKEKGDKQNWTPAASQFAGRMVAAIVALDKALRSSAEFTPEPAWATNARYTLGPESKFRVQLLEAERQVEIAQKHKEQVAEELKSAGAFRGLLFEKGNPLEGAIIDALRLLGFQAAPYKDSSSEFDVVFESDEGRLIGEAEGKDSKAVNIDKLRQLAMNIHEDLQREEVSSPAKPVLFGNAFRLQPIDERPDPFTEKCHAAAAASSTALVFTPDLFWLVQYLSDHADNDYARSCRQALLSATGRVTFPPPPVTLKPEEEIGEEAVK